MYAYHRLWLTLLVLAIVTTSMCGFANEHDVSESGNLMAESHFGTSQSAASLKDLNGNTEFSKDLSLELKNSLRFEPAQLDFGIWSVGTVRSHTVTLVNDNSNRSVHLTSVSCGTPAFTSSFFEASMVPPNGNTTFKVVFLPREEGALSTSLHIHTSFGKVQLMVRGEGRECPYRLKPLVGIRAPLNATLMPEIHMYNPHQKALQVLEVYSSGGHFQLELPSGDNEGPKGLWEIPPLTTKPIIRIRFQGHTPGNYSAFIRIKIAEPLFNSSDANRRNEEQILVIPVEFEILPKYGVYAVNPLLDFGQLAVGIADMKVFSQKLFLKHSQSQLDVNELEFESMTYLSGVYFQNNTTIELIPHDMTDTVVRLNEKLELILKNKTSYTYHIDLMLRADIFKGNLYYNVNKTLFLIDTPDKANNRLEELEEDGIDNAVSTSSLDNRLLKLRNDFQIPMIVFNITSSSSESVKLSLQLPSMGEMGTILRPGHSIDLYVSTALQQKEIIKQQKSEQDLKDLQNYKTVIYVFTNITNFEIPIVISTARLFVTTQTHAIWHHNTSVYTKELHLGSVLLHEVSRNGFIILQNRNSIPIHLSNIGVKKPQGVYYHVYYHGCIKASELKENSNNNGIDLEKANYRITSLLEEGDAAVYVANIQSYLLKHNTAHFRISTEYENITVDIKFTTALGRLEVDQEKFHFINCFPGKLCSSDLSIRSTFKHSIHVKSINFTNPGFRFEDKSLTGSKIAPQTVTTIGRIYFEPSALCGSRCYIQHNDESLVFGNLPDILNLSSDIPVFDEVELTRRIELYRQFKSYFQIIVFTMTTKEMQNFQLNLMIELEWPQLVNSRQVLPTVEVNKSITHHVKISNPSDEPILIDYRLSNSFYAMYTKIYLPLEVVNMIPGCYLGDMPFFSLVNAPPKKPILIPGLSSITIPIKFQADFASSQCTVLHIRNNLTLYEGVWISAKAVQSQFRLGNRKPGSKTPLLFEITEHHLASACPAMNERIKENQMDRYVQPQVISRRVFTARNSGELPIRIDSFWIGNQPCKGYGFQVTDCNSFDLKANSSRKIEISYQTDFTATRVSRPLTLKTNLTYEVNYILVAQMPTNGFEQCWRLLPRPLWEQKIRNAAIVMLLITFFLVLVAVHIDYGNIIYNQSALYEAREKGTVHPTFNLRNIAIRSTLQTNESHIQVNEPNNKTGKPKAPAVEKFDNANNSMMNLKRRNVKNSSKTTNSESKSASGASRKTMSLADMVSWTFGSKNSKKTSTNNKNVKAVNDQTNSNSLSQPTGNEIKTTKPRLTEKSLIDKMDNDLKKSQTYKKTKTYDKVMNKSIEKPEEDSKRKAEENNDKEMKKDKNSPKVQSKPNVSANNSMDGNTSSVKGTKEQQRKSSDLTSQEAYFDNSAITVSDRNQNSPKETTANGRKIGKTPGRERRKQSAQSSSPATSDATSSSCSSSTSSSCSSNHNTTAKRHERKSKVKASNSLKFNSNINNLNNMFPIASSSSSSPTSLTSSLSTGLKTESVKSHIDILSPWDSSTSQVSFSDVLQKPQPQLYAKAKQSENIASNNDLKQQESLFSDLLPNSHSRGLENSEIVAALTPKRPKNPTTDLGPIGSRKSPSSTPVWEPLHSAITMQLPRPINANPTTSSTSPSSSSATSSFYPLSSNFSYNDLTTQMPSSLHQQQQDIQAQLLVLQRQLLEQQHLQQQQQQQQFLNSNTLSSNWSSSLWGPILGNSSTTSHASTSSIFNQTPAQNSAWSLPSPPTSSPTGGLVRPPPGLEQNFSLTTGMNNNQTLVASSSTVAPISSTFSSTFNSPLASSAANTANNDNMPMFNLFGGLSSIWNDNWKQTTNQQQPQQQQQEQQQQPSPPAPPKQ